MMHKENSFVAVCHTMENPPSPPQPVLLMDELMIEIMSLLPVKSLLRFRCVSKSWSSLIFDPRFVKLHLLRSPKHANLFLASTYHGRDFTRNLIVMSCPKSSFLENPSFAFTLLEGEEGSIRLNNRYSVIGSCNGLVCLNCSESFFNLGQKEFSEHWFRFWNPATRLRSKKSPYFRTKVSSPVFGFGYAESIDAYKVVALLLDGYLPPKKLDIGIQVKVYTMGDHHWRDIQPFPALPLVGSVTNFQGTFVSGNLNWLARRNYSPDDKLFEVAIDQIVIISLDLEKETYEQFLLPNGLDDVPQNYSLAVLMDCLCLCHDYKLTHFVIWQMQEFGVEKSWTQFVKVSYDHLGIPIPIRYYYCSMKPMCISENGDALMLRDVQYKWKILYNRRHNTVEHSHKPNKKRTLTNVSDYAQSLVLPY